MLTWIQNHLIRHGRWIFLTLLAVVIVAFVFTIGNVPGLAPQSTAYERLDYYGYDLNSESDMSLPNRLAMLSLVIQTGQLPQTNQQLQQLVLNRIALLDLANAIGIPAPDPVSLQEFLHSIPRFANPTTGEFDRSNYLQFIDAINADPQFTAPMVAKVLEDDLRIQRLYETLTGPGFSLPGEAIHQATRDNITYSVATAEMALESFQPEINPDPETLKSFFEENVADYEIPERIKAGYVLFRQRNFEPDAVPEDSVLRDFFIKNRERIVAFYEAEQAAKGETPSEDSEVAFEQVRERVIIEYKSDQALRAANEAAAAFAYRLYDQQVVRDSDEFKQLLAENGVTEIPIQPFSGSDLQSGGLPPELLGEALALNEKRYYSDAYPVQGGYAVLIYRGRIDPETPPFEYVATTVKNDYIAKEKSLLFEEHGKTLKAAIESAMAAGSTFEDAAREQGLETALYEDFKSAEAPPELSRALFERAEALDEGGISGMVTTADKGAFVYVAKKETPELALDSEEVQAAEDFIKRYSKFTSRSTGVNQLVSRGVPDEAKAEQ